MRMQPQDRQVLFSGPIPAATASIAPRRCTAWGSPPCGAVAGWSAWPATLPAQHDRRPNTSRCTLPGRPVCQRGSGCPLCAPCATGGRPKTSCCGPPVTGPPFATREFRRAFFFLGVNALCDCPHPKTLPRQRETDLKKRNGSGRSCEASPRRPSARPLTCLPGQTPRRRWRSCSRRRWAGSRGLRGSRSHSDGGPLMCVATGVSQAPSPDKPIGEKVEVETRNILSSTTSSTTLPT